MASLVPFLAIFLIPLVSGSHLTNRVFKWTITEPVGYVSVGKRLDGHWFYQTYKKDVSLCAYQCLRKPECLSFNYESDSGKCILNRKNHQTVALINAPSNYVSYHAREEYSIDREALGPCADDVCHSKGRCLETKTTDDQLVAICVCNKGWGGPDCNAAEPQPQWGTWQDWDDCSVTCDQGWRMRRRNCEDGSSGQTLSPLQCYGRDIEYGSCQLQACPRWDSWGVWGTCSTYQTCGRGYKVRNRTCNNGGTPGVDRYCLGPTNETTVCYSMDCQSPVRLRGGSAHGEGRVEIFNDEARQWGMICGNQWTQTMADLVCKHLGMPGAHMATQNSQFGTGGLMYGVTSLSCQGLEQTVQMCERNPWSLTPSCPTTTQPAGVMCRVNGVWSLWGEWGDCSVSCETGIQQRTRSCNHPPALHGGKDCEGETVQTKSCTLDMCPGNGTWQDWGMWGPCDCGLGEQVRERDCVNATDVCTGNATDVQACGAGMCTTGTVDGVWKTWAAWSECSTSCGKGSQWRQRTCEGPFYHGQECQGERRQTQECQVRECPVDGVWNGWETWGDCSDICGGGMRSRTRTCQGPFFLGAPCPGEVGHTEECNTFECPVDGSWLPWHDWRDCSVTCGGGQQIRKRDCLKPKFGGSNCEGERQQTRQCSTQECPVDASWLTWGQWGECNETCGGGNQRRMRSCQEGLNGGRNCSGPAEDFQTCNTHACPGNNTKLVLVDGEEIMMVLVDGEWQELVDGVWREWNEWSACSHRCDTGTQTRNRTCDGPYYGGSDCVGSGSDVRNCNTHTCAVDGVWTSWSNWSLCPVTCGGSTSLRSRSCDGPYFGGINCNGLWSEGQPCGTEPCPIDGVWETWSKWSTCPVTCGGSTSRRSRSCDGPQFGGKNCSAPWVEERHCGIDPCPIDGVWKPWSQWSVCPVTCGGSTSKRSRSCEGPYFNGTNCTIPWNEDRPCGEDPCPIDGVWEPWSELSVCPVNSGGGTSRKSRSCFTPYFNGKNCSDLWTEATPCGTYHCPIDGVWTTWSTWGLCNVTCGGGSQSRSRNCIEPQFGGKVCEGDGVQLKRCNDNQCPIDGVFQTWEEWGACSVTCGGGQKMRSRKCTGPFYGGGNCTGPWEDRTTCSNAPCPVDGTWLSWGTFSECDLTCGGGIRSRKRECDGPFFGGADCSGNREEQEVCSEQNCPVDGEWQNWEIWGTCSTTCGGGIQWRQRGCMGPFWDGQDCSGDSKESRDCNTQSCPEDGYFNDWAQWSLCDVTCGGGIRWRNRTCSGPFYGGADCDGARNESEACNDHNCPVDGIFNDWSDWDACSATCGGGDKLRQRTCHGPFYGGKDCVGPREDTAPCNQHNCPVDGIWETWHPWGACSESCGGGIQQRERECQGPLHAGKECEGAHFESRDCNNHTCPVDGIWAEWAKWSTCTLTCGGGQQWRSRNCIGPFDGGKECPGPRNVTQACSTDHCPIDGVYGEWSSWGACSDTCGGGTQDRTRSCTAPKFGGVDCQGPAVDTMACNTNHCPVDGVWLDWSKWGECSATCGGGSMKRVRVCDPPKYGGADCVGDTEELESCNPNLCPIPGDWFTWEQWSTCSVTCGGGTKSRSRTCDMTSHGNLTSPCEGPNEETIECHTFACTPLARTCSEWGVRGLLSNTMADIDPDEAEGLLEPTRVYCDMTSQNGAGVTVIGHDSEEEEEVVGYEGAGEYVLGLNYNVTLDHAIAIIDASENCRQFVQWRCKAALIHNPNGNGIITTGWRNRTGGIADYLGDATPGSGMCTCGMTQSCADPTLACNCDMNDDVWREDSGYLSYRPDLPVTEFIAGDTGGMNEGGYKTIGPLFCWGVLT